MGFFDKVERFIDDVLLLPDEVRETLQAGDAALDAGAHDEAERLFLEVLHDRPTLARAAVGLAHARHGLGDSAGTLAALIEARELVPEDGELALWTARVAQERGETELALNSARAATRALVSVGGEKFADACAALAWAEWGRGRADRAARELRKALSAAPHRTELKVALVEALVDAGDLGPARTAGAGVDPASVTPAAALRVGRALLRAGAAEPAHEFFAAAADAGVAEALVELTREALTAGDLTDAENRARRAVAQGVGAPALAVLGEVLAARGSLADGAEAFAAAASASGDASLWRAAARTVPVEDVTLVSRYEASLEAAHPGDPAARALRAWLAVARDVAPELADEGEEPRAHLAVATHALSIGEPARALEALDAFERARETISEAIVDVPRAEDARRDALRALWLSGGEVDLAAAIDAVSRFAEEHGLREVARDAARLRDELDRPLLLAVLGEFNAGKSTLINAFIGADVAPMGIVPTTATLNLLRGGAERLVRVVFHDGHTREGPYEKLKPWLRELEALGANAVGAARVDQVEIVLPSDTLERVWILDAPGTNALDAAHEDLAREAARRADAVMWVFDAAQAGKLTETKMHDALRAQGRVVVPVLNKRDRLREGELEEVSAVVEAGFGQPPVPVSAKAALKSRLAEDDAAYEASGFPALLTHLDEKVFSRARPLKRAACAGRLAAALDGALAQGRAELSAHAEARETLAARREALAGVQPDLLLAVDDAVRALDADLDAAFEAAADEVLSFVRPRRSRFARHGVHPEDRAFLREVLERRVRRAVGDCERRLRARLRGLLTDLAAEDPREVIDAALAPPLAAFLGYQRGRLASGAIEHFFEDQLPHADLERRAMVTALAPARAGAREELRGPLNDAVLSLHGAIDAAAAASATTSEAADIRVATRVFAPMDALREVLGEIATAAIGP